MDVDLDTHPPDYPNRRSNLRCADCGELMVLRESKYGPFYGCGSFPKCRGTLSAHQDGRPKGKPGTAETKKARIEAHKVFDRIWKEGRVSNRGQAYTWMRKALNLRSQEAHIGEFSIAQCEKLIRFVHRDFPELKTKWDRLLADPFDSD